MSLLTAEFLECTPYTSVPTSTVFVTSYIVTLPAACPTSEWEATYTITTTCTGNQGQWTPPAVPPEFVATTVVCDVCAHKSQVITCPNAEATNVVVGGNGITATVAPTPAANGPAVPANTCGAGGCVVPSAAETPAAPAATAPAAGGAPAPAAETPAPAGGAPVVTPISNPPASTDYVQVAGAPLSVKKSLGVAAALALVAGQFLML